MRTFWNFFSSGRLVFGPGSVSQLGRLVARRDLRRVLAVTDKNLEQAGVVDQVKKCLQQSGLTVEVFDGGEPEPSLATSDAAMRAAENFGPDAILGLGGGSNMDLAKIVALLTKHGGTPADYFGFDRVPGPVTPLICVPTTAGTGSEVSHSAVLTDTVNRIKVSTLSEHLRPLLAVVDPALSHSCPPKATADSGIDALTHAIEAYTAIDFRELDAPADGETPYSGKSPMGDALAENAISLIGQNLITAVREPGNAVAREKMALAATLAGLAFSNGGVSLVHALEYPLGGELHVSHGAGNGLLLPYVMRYNLPVRTKELAQVAALLGAEVRGLDDVEAAEMAIMAVESLKRETGIPERLRDIGAAREQLPGFAAKSFAIKRLVSLNPRPVDEAGLLGILESAF